MSDELLAAARMLGADPRALAALRPLREVGALDAVDVYAAAAMAARFGESDPDVLLAAALAVRAPRFGHVGVDLLGLDGASLRAFAASPRSVGLPVDRAAWRERIARSPLVRAPGPGDAPLVLRGPLLTTDRYFAYEERLRLGLVERFAARRPPADPALLARGLAALFPDSPGVDAQRRAAQVALERGIAVISGGPGTGKTWTVRNLLTLAWAQAIGAGLPAPRVALAAPTGKAAARVVASIRSELDAHLGRAVGALPAGADPAGLAAFLDGAAPTTLHRLLGWRPETPTRFRHDAQRPLPLDLLVVDEASMVDLALMAKLVDAVPPDARLVLLGDRHQLASVEAGSVLADLCGSERGGSPSDAVVFLTESRRFRSDGGIGRFASAAVRGEVDAALAAIPVGGAEIERVEPPARGGLPASVRQRIVEGYRPYLERLRAGCRPGEDLAALHADALRRFDGFRVLCAHRDGPEGVEGLDAAITALLSDAGLIAPDGPWWVGRPVIVTRNDYGVRRFNGDVGLVARDPDGAPVVAFPAGSGGVSWLAPVRLPEHETVFAMTIHKSQGSEFDDVLVVLPGAPSPVLTRELVYTGVTRARRRVAVLAREEVLRAGLARRVQRASGLADALWSTGDPVAR